MKYKRTFGKIRPEVVIRLVMLLRMREVERLEKLQESASESTATSSPRRRATVIPFPGPVGAPDSPQNW